jgi:uncharacterized protein YaiI (UPF0178 family)
MKVIIDGDGCPIINIASNLCKKYSLDILIVHNFTQNVELSYGRNIVVDKSRDRADFIIANNCAIGDLVLTNDIGLMAMILSKKGKVLNFSGKLVDDNNIQILIDQRYLNRLERENNRKYTKIPKRTKNDDEMFKNELEKFLIEYK